MWFNGEGTMLGACEGANVSPVRVGLAVLGASDGTTLGACEGTTLGACNNSFRLVQRWNPPFGIFSCGS